MREYLNIKILTILNRFEIKHFSIILIFLLGHPGINAQIGGSRVKITGRVTDVDNRPISNAIILIDNIKTSSITDSLGNYRVKVKPSASRIAVFTFTNGIKEEYIDGRTRIDMTFAGSQFSKLKDGTTSHTEMGLRGTSNREGDQAVEVGYATLKKKYLTTDISYIDGTKPKYASYSSVYDMIQREVSGVMVMGKSIIIQGSANMFGSVAALIIIDGTYAGDLDLISPVSVESISVLKGTSAAIYGSRGYGGAIIVTTKKYNGN